MTLAYDDVGSGPAVLLLHAGVADRRMWRAQIAACAAAGLRAIAPDLRGFGNSPVSDVPFSHVDDVLELLDSLGVETAAVVGASFGGLVAQELAGRHPHRVGGLVLLCPATALLEPDSALMALWEQEEALVAAGDLDSATALNVRTWVGPEADEDARALVGLMQRQAFELQVGQPDPEGNDGETDPRDITVSTLVVTGSHDLTCFQDAARSLARRVQNGRLVELDWAGHLPSLERPDETAGLVVAALANVV